MHRAPVNRNTANVGGMVGGREGGRWPEKDGTPLTGRRGRQIDLVERVPALDAGDYDTRETGLPFERHLTGPWAARDAAAGGGSRVSRPVRDRRFPPTKRIRRLRGLPDRHMSHQSRPTGTGMYSVEQPHQSGIWNV